MRTSHYVKLSQQVQQQTVTLVLRKLRPPDFSSYCPAWLLHSCLVLAAAARVSLAAVAAVRTGCPSRETLRQALLATLPEYASLLQQLPGLLRASLPRGLRKHPRRRYPMAIDVHGVPYYKRHRTPPEHVRRGQKFAGTGYGHLYATASLLRKGQYYVVAMIPYDPGENKVSLVRRLLQQALRNGFSPRYLLMDRGFWSAAVFRYLQQARYPFLIPVLARGKKPTTPGGPTGTQVFFHRCRSGWYTYTVTERNKKLTARLTIVVQRRNRGGARGRHGRYTWAYGMWRMKLSTIRWVRQCYRRRFRIESSYRLLEEVRGRTSSRNEGWRLWYVILAVLLLNVWLQLRPGRARGRGPAADEWRWWNRLLVALLYRLLLEPAVSDRPSRPGELPTPSTT